jgi:hypothetical protein
MIQKFHSLVCIGGIAGFSLTFFHPALWAWVGVMLGLALLLLTPQILAIDHSEPRGFYIALIWIFATTLFAFANGFSEGFYNVRQIVLMLAGLVFGYFLSLYRVRSWVAWIPFGIFALYFAVLMILGRDPNDVFTRNSQNYISVILLALYASAVIMTRPPSLRIAHIAAAGLVLVLAVWAAGRGGILASLLLIFGLLARLVIQGRSGIIKWLLVVFTIFAVAMATYFAAEMLERGGYLYKFEGRGLRDPSRLTILISYFDDIETSELLLGRNYYDDSIIGRWGFNLHNSYLDAWAHLSIWYLLFVMTVVLIAFRRLREQPVIAITVLAFAARAVTDSQLFSGQYDFVIFATFFVLVRRSGDIAQWRPPIPIPRIQRIQMNP